MELLDELLLIVDGHKLKALKQMDFLLDENSKLTKLYQIIANNEFDSEEQIADYLYPSSSEKERADSYRHLRAKLIQRLSSILLLTDENQADYSEYQKAYYQCHKDWTVIQSLLGKNARIAAVELAEKTIKQTIKYEFTELTVSISKILRMHYAAREGDHIKFQYYNEQYKAYKVIRDLESEVEEYYLLLVINYVNDRSKKEDIHHKAKQYYNIVKEYLDLHEAYHLHLHGFLIKLMIYTTINDYKTTIEVCQEGIDFFAGKGFEARVPLQIFYYQKMVCHIQRKEVQQGSVTADKCLELSEEGSFNWFKYHELYFSLHIHSQDYQNAYHLYQRVTAHKRFRFLPENVKEVWKIYKAYLHYLKEHGIISVQEDDNDFSKFKLGRFLNETPTYSKDKRGMNIAILVIHILFYILQKKYGKTIDRVEAIKQYSYRYLHQDNTYRSNCFIKMLLLIPKADFHKQAVIRKTQPYLKKLQKVPLEVDQLTHEIEIIPYEHLWELVIKSLEKNFTPTSKKI